MAEVKYHRAKPMDFMKGTGGLKVSKLTPEQLKYRRETILRSKWKNIEVRRECDRKISRQKTISGKNKKYYAIHKDRFKELRRQRYLADPKKHYEYWKKHYLKNMNAQIAHILRTRIREAIGENLKGKGLYELLGADVKTVRQHLEKQFKNGMSWVNRGKWHFDHIIPVTVFDLSKTEEQRKAFHYTNLQPLWAYENQSKGNRLIQ